MLRSAVSVIGLAALAMGLVVPGIASAERGRGHDDDRSRGRPAHIEWQQSKVELTLEAGASQTVTVQFRPTQDVAHASLVVRPGNASIQVSEPALGVLRAGQEYSAKFTAHLPENEHRSHRRAQVFVEDGQRRLGPPLRVDVRNASAEDKDEDKDDEKDDRDDEDRPAAHLTWTPRIIVAPVQVGGTFTTTVSFVSDRALDDVRVRTRTWLGLSLAAQPSELAHVSADQSVALTLTAQAPAEFNFAVLLGKVTLTAGDDDDRALAPPLWLVLGVVPAPPPATDQTPPTVAASQSPAANANGWNNTDVQVSLTATDEDGGSGMAEIRYRVNGGGEVIVPGATATISVSANGTTTMTYRALDRAGNASAEGSHTVRIDRQAPTVTASETSDHVVTVTAADNEGGSGVAEIRYRIGGGAEQVVAGDLLRIVVTGTGETTLTFRAADKAGNLSTEGSHVVRIQAAATLHTASASSAPSHDLRASAAMRASASHAAREAPAAHGREAEISAETQADTQASVALSDESKLESGPHGAGQAIAAAALEAGAKLRAGLGIGAGLP